MKNMKVIMIGPIPPPIGGVSIHLSRLVLNLNDEFDITTIDTSKNRIKMGYKLIKEMIKTLLYKNKVIVHSHIFNLKFSFLLTALCKLFSVGLVQTIHSFRVSEEEVRKKSSYYRFILKRLDTLIVVNEQIKNRFLLLDSTIENRIQILPAFIPFKMDFDESKSMEYINNIGAKRFIDAHDIIIVANAYKITFYNDEDLYGLDLCVAAMKHLRSINSYNVGFVFLLPQIGENEYFKEIMTDIVTSGIEQDFLFVNKEVPLVPIFGLYYF